MREHIVGEVPGQTRGDRRLRQREPDIPEPMDGGQAAIGRAGQQRSAHDACLP